MPLAPDRWEKVAEIFDASLAFAPEERARFVRERTGDDQELADEVASLLSALDDAADRYERPAVASLEHGAEVHEAPARSRVGDRIGAYEIIREVGHGGMGAIYEAVRADDQYRKRVAIKTIWRGGDSQLIVRRFRQERQILAGLDHPNIAALLDGGMAADGQPYIVMEFVEGRPIDAYCSEHRLSIRQRVALCRQVCAAVQYAHRNLVVHRDLKPGNIFVTADGVVKLLDFGIAKLLPPDEVGDSTLTRAGLHPLTTAYASPEQVRGESIATSSDVYSLAVVLYELLCGAPPFPATGATPLELQRRICDELPVRPSEAVTDQSATGAGLGTAVRVRRELAGELDDIVMMALRKEPERRYASVEQFAEDLRRYLEQLPILARRDSVSYRLSKFVRRNRGLVVAGSVAVVSLVAGVTGVALQARATARERDRAREAEVVATRQRARAEQVSLFLRNMLGAADPSWYSATERPGPQTTIGSIIDAAARRVDGELAADPDAQAAVLQTLGAANVALTRFDTAKRQLDASLALHRKLFGETSVEVAKDQYLLGLMLYRRGEVAGSEPVLRQAIAMFRAVGDSTSDEYGRAVNDLGISLLGLGRAAEAESLIAQSLAHRRAMAGTPIAPIAILLSNLALARDVQGNVSEAEPAYREALAVFNQARPREYFERGYTLHNLALVLMLRGKHREAIDLMEQTVALWTSLLGATNPTVAVGLVGLARVLHAAGEETRALHVARRAEAIFARALPPTHPDVARAQAIIGQVLVAQGRVPEGEQRLRRAVDIRRAALGRRSMATLETEVALGTAVYRQRRFAEAESLMVPAYRLIDSLQSAGSPRRTNAAASIAEMYLAWGSREKAAEFQAASRRP